MKPSLSKHLVLVQSLHTDDCYIEGALFNNMTLHGKAESMKLSHIAGMKRSYAKAAGASKTTVTRPCISATSTALPLFKQPTENNSALNVNNFQEGVVVVVGTTERISAGNTYLNVALLSWVKQRLASTITTALATSIAISSNDAATGLHYTVRPWTILILTYNK